jgi:protein-S-isoprenylcysteine O-methyltransferase Ste14
VASAPSTPDPASPAQPSSWSKIARRIRVPMGFVFALLYLWLARPTWKSIALGSAIAIPGLLIRGLASGHVKKNEQLASSGPYAYTRNPLYLGSLILTLGFSFAARNWWILGGALLIFVVVYLPVIHSEEAFLRKTFPEFDNYASHVPRIVPRLTAFGNKPGAFSWPLYLKHREYNAILGAVAMIAALVSKLLWMAK